MPTLNIYNKTGELLEVYSFEGSMISWLENNVENYTPSTRPPYSALLNGEPWPYINHGDLLAYEDVIELTIEPQSPPQWVFWAIAIISAAYSYYVASNIEIPEYQDAAKGDRQSIYSPSARANNAKPSGIIRESAGMMHIYPDLINPVRRKYEDNKEYLYMLLCLGVGHYSVNETNFYISETPIINYQSDYELTIFEPGEDISSHEAHENWYESKEIQALELSTEERPVYGVWQAEYSGSTLTLYRDGGTIAFPFYPGDQFTLIGGTNSGTYIVSSINSPNTSAEVLATVLKTVIVSTPGGQIVGGQYYEPSGPAAFTSPSPEREDVNINLFYGGTTWFGPYRPIPENERSRHSEFDVVFPNGITAVDESTGENLEISVTIEVQWRAVGDETWNTVANTVFSGATRDELAYTISIDYGSEIRPEVRFRRVTAEATSTSTADSVEIRRFKTLLETRTSFPGVTLAAVRFRGSNTLARNSENKVNVRGATRRLPTLAEIQAGSFDLSDEHATRNPVRFAAYAIYDTLKDSSLIDFDAFSAMESLADSREDWLDAEFVDETTLFDALKVIFLPLYAEPATKEGKLLPVRIDASLDYSHVYTPDSMLDDGLQVETMLLDSTEPDGVDVEYYSLTTYQNEVVECRLSDDLGARPTRIQATGITDRTKAWRLGMRERSRIKLKPMQFSFTTEMDALNSEYGDGIAIASDLFASQFGEITAHASSTLTVNFNPNFGSGAHYIAVRDHEGQFSALHEATPGAAPNEITISPELAFTPTLDGSQERPLVSFGGAESWGKKAVVRRIEPASDGRVTVLADEFIPQIYANDDREPG